MIDQSTPIAEGDLRDTIQIVIDRQVCYEIDQRRGGVPRSGYIEMLLRVGLAETKDDR